MVTLRVARATIHLSSSTAQPAVAFQIPRIRNSPPESEEGENSLECYGYFLRNREVGESLGSFDVFAVMVTYGIVTKKMK